MPEASRDRSLGTFGRKNMTLDPKIFDMAYAKLEEFGPQRGIQIPERLKTDFPKLSDSERKEIETMLEEVRKTVWSLAELGGEAKMKKEEILSELRVAHPFLYDIGLKQAYFLVNYYAWHEGYDK